MIPSGSPRKRFSFRAAYVRLYRQTVQQQERERKHENKIIRRRACCERGHDCSSEPTSCSGSPRGISQRRSVPVARRFTLRCGQAVFHRSTQCRCSRTAVDRFIQANAIPRLACVRHPASAYRQPVYSSGGSFTRSGPYTVATIPQRNRVAPFANRRNPAVTRVWNQRNTGTQFRNANNLRNPNNLRNANNLRNGNNHLRRDWQKHVFSHRSGGWHREWNRNCDHWWNGHRCSFIHGSWVIFNLGFSPWWSSSSPDDYYYDYGFPNDGYGSSTYGYDYPYSYQDSDPGETSPGITKGRCITIKTVIPINRRATTIPVFTKLKRTTIRMPTAMNRNQKIRPSPQRRSDWLAKDISRRDRRRVQP